MSNWQMFFVGFFAGIFAMYWAWENVWFSYSLRKGIPFDDLWKDQS